MSTLSYDDFKSSYQQAIDELKLLHTQRPTDKLQRMKRCLDEANERVKRQRISQTKHNITARLRQLTSNLDSIIENIYNVELSDKSSQHLQDKRQIILKRIIDTEDELEALA